MEEKFICPDSQTASSRLSEISSRKIMLYATKRAANIHMDEARRNLKSAESSLRSLEDELRRLDEEETKIWTEAESRRAAEKLVRDMVLVCPGDYVEAKFTKLRDDHESSELLIVKGVVSINVYPCSDGGLEGVYELGGLTFRKGSGKPGDRLREIIGVNVAQSNP